MQACMLTMRRIFMSTDTERCWSGGKNPRGRDTHPLLREKWPHRRQSLSMQNAWMRRRILPCGSLAFYRASRGLSTRESRLWHTELLEYALRVPINRASRSPGISFLRIVHTYTYNMYNASPRSHPHIIRSPTSRILKSYVKHHQWWLRNTDEKDQNVTDIFYSRFLIPLKIIIH